MQTDNGQGVTTAEVMARLEAFRSRRRREPQRPQASAPYAAQAREAALRLGMPEAEPDTLAWLAGKREEVERAA